MTKGCVPKERKIAKDGVVARFEDVIADHVTCSLTQNAFLRFNTEQFLVVQLTSYHVLHANYKISKNINFRKF